MKDDPFNVVLVKSAIELHVPAVFQSDDDIGLAPASACRDHDRLASGFHSIPISGRKDAQDVTLEIAVSVGGVRELLTESKPLTFAQPCQVLLERAFKLYDNIHVAFGVDVRVVAVRALQEDLVRFVRVWCRI